MPSIPSASALVAELSEAADKELLERVYVEAFEAAKNRETGFGWPKPKTDVVDPKAAPSDTGTSEPASSEPASLGVSVSAGTTEPASSGAESKEGNGEPTHPERKPEGNGASRLASDLERTLEQGARDPRERQLLAAATALSLAQHTPLDPDAVAERLLWLATHTPCNAFAALDAALGDAARPIWKAVHAMALDPRAAASDFSRDEGLTAASALRASNSAAARAAVLEIDETSQDPLIWSVVSPNVEPAPETRLRGELGFVPQGPFVTFVLALTLVLLVLHVARWVGRFALAYRRPAELTLTTRGLEIRSHTEVLGRVLRDHSTVIPLSNLAAVKREVRYARAGMYAGLFALFLGTYFGMGLFVDGVRVPGGSTPLLGLSLLLVLLGLALDFALTTLSDAVRGRCRLVVVPRVGRRLCVAGLDPQETDAVLARIAKSVG